jgi:dihydroorotase-like cyclic amidohydrolase
MTEADIGIAGGRIVAIATPGGLPKSRRAVDARGRHVLPGIIDPHTHFGSRVPVEKDIETESRAALAGGVTTIGWFVRSAESYLETAAGFEKAIVENASADMFVHYIVSTDQHIDELPRYAAELGVTSFKAYMAGLRGSVDDDFLFRLFRAAADLGPQAIVCVHAENEAIVEKGTSRMNDANVTYTLADWSNNRPALAEAEAIRRCAFLADTAGATAYIVHLNSAEELDQIRIAKAAGSHLLAEAGTHYLSLTVDHPLGVLVKRSPPVRTGADVDALWAGIADGSIETVGTDQVVGSKESNNPDKGIVEARLGFTILGLHLPIALHEGHHLRGVSLERIVDAMSTQPAKIFGLYPRKGAIAVGADADIAIVDLARERTVDYRELHTWSDFTPWDGQTLRGWPVATIKGGVVAVEENEILVKPGSGNYLRRQLPARTPA